jgi:hypothetical protein
MPGSLRNLKNFDTLQKIALPDVTYHTAYYSISGTWMQRIALGWLVYRLTNSAFLLGLVGFASQIPTFLLASFAGVLADRRDRHHILILTQTLAMAQAFVLSFLVLFDLIRIWHVIILSIILGIINAFDMPTRQSFMVKMVEGKKDLSHAIALNSIMVNSARLRQNDTHSHGYFWFSADGFFNLKGIVFFPGTNAADRHRPDDCDGFEQHPFADCCR